MKTVSNRYQFNKKVEKLKKGGSRRAIDSVSEMYAVTILIPKVSLYMHTGLDDQTIATSPCLDIVQTLYTKYAADDNSHERKQR